MTETAIKEQLKKKDKVSSTFIDNMKLPVHGWFRYTAGFSAEWVKTVFDKFPESNNILDPFVGSGTVLLEGQLNGKNTYGVEAHMLIHKVAESKLLWTINPDEFEVSSDLLLTQVLNFKLPKKKYPQLLVKCYSEETLNELFKMKYVWENLNVNEDHKKLLWFVITSILRVSSSAGTAQWQYVLPGKTKSRILAPLIAYQDKINSIIKDMKLMQSKNLILGNTTLIKGDARTLNGIPDNSIDLVVTSPPYANNYDYADATRIELSFWEEIDNWGELQNLVKNDIVRACTQHVAHIKNEIDELFESECLNPIRDELKKQFDLLSIERLSHGGKKNYHLMALAYFKDMGDTFVALRRVCAENSNICFVVGDSAPYGIYLPVDKWLGELAIGAGFNSYYFEKTRDRNVKWKNRKHTIPLKEGRLWIK
ncbi:hypothetical protein [Flavobacterium suncheonense]|nr:hypothetical protein [Flavobacterium suncheonense]